MKTDVIRGKAYDIFDRFAGEVPVDMGRVIQKLGGSYKIQSGFDGFYDGTVLKRGKNFLFRVPAYLEAQPQAERLIRYELATDLGHLLLHMEGKQEGVYQRFTETKEIEDAKIFADFLLMPETEFAKELEKYTDLVDTKKLADHFGVIEQVATRCGVSRNLINSHK